MPSFPVQTRPVQLSQIITQSALIQNNGPDTLYLGIDSSVTSSAYAMRVTAGATVNWPGNSELWAVSDGTSQVGVLFGANGASVSQVVSQTDLSVTLIGVITNGGPLTTLSNLDKYQTLFVTAVPVGALAPAPASNDMQISWLKPDGAVLWIDNYASVCVDTNAQFVTAFTIPILTSSCMIVPNGVSSGMVYYVYGSRKALPTVYQSGTGTLPVDSKYFAFSHVSSSADSFTKIIPHRGGPAQLTVTTNGGSGNLQAFILTQTNEFVVTLIPTSTGSVAVATIPIVLPYTPLKVQLNYAGAATATHNVSLTFAS